MHVIDSTFLPVHYNPHHCACNVSITELKVELYHATLIENLFPKLSVKQESYSSEF